MTTVIVDYESGNLHSVAKSFERMARETETGTVVVSADPAALASASRIVLPGVGAFADCRAGLAARQGLFEAMEARVLDGGVPFLGICVGMQMLADWGREHGVETRGFGWIAGDVEQISPSDLALKVPHMGWNERTIRARCWRMWIMAAKSPLWLGATTLSAHSSTRKKARKPGWG